MDADRNAISGACSAAMVHADGSEAWKMTAVELIQCEGRQLGGAGGVEARAVQGRLDVGVPLSTSGHSDGEMQC